MASRIGNPKFPCGVCQKNVTRNQKSIQCSKCCFWIHAKCNNISNAEFDNLSKEMDNVPWYCINCEINKNASIFPFGNEENEDFLKVFDLKSPCFADCTPTYEITSHLTNLPNLSDYDIDEQMPQTLDSRYFTLPELSSLHYSSSDLSVLHTNIRSLSCHHEELIALCNQLTFHPDVIGVSEIWDSDNHPITTNVDIPGYTLYKTSSSSQNGGVGLYIKSSLTAIHRNDLNISNSDFETVWVEIDNKKSKNMLFCCVYRHPSTDIETLTDHFENIFAKISLNKLVFIMGDFNINLLNYDSHTPTNDFINFLSVNNFLPCIHHPSRVSDQSESVIDNIFTNAIGDLTCGNILTQISDHFPQFMVMKNSKIVYNETVSFKHDFSKLNEQNFIEDFNNLDLSFLEFDNMDVNEKFDRFLEVLSSLSSKHAPITKRSKKEIKFKNKPWINRKIQKMMKIRDKILHKLKKNKSANNLTLYKKFRNRVSNEIKQSKARYYYNYFHENNNNMKKLWSGIKTIISQKSTTPSTINKIKDDFGNITSDPSDMSNIFNNFFTTVADKITSKIPKTPKSPLDYLQNRNPASLFLSPVTSEEILDLINLLDSSKSVGPNSIPIKMLKIIGSSISPCLASLVNKSFQVGIFPNKLKVAKVISLFKKGDPELPSNYRPISLLPIFSKLFEKLMYKRLYRFLEVHNIFYSLQFGFQENRSIDHALISMTESIRSTLDCKKFGCGVFIDLQKAFDTVNHQILLSKLEHYGIRGCALDWFKSYLFQRKQYVSINGQNSSLLTVNCGVPQGSVLGPLLFLIYINDLPLASTKLKFYLFADDTNIYLEDGNLTHLVKTVNKELKFVMKWLNANKLSLNIEKTNFILFHSMSIKVPSDINIKIGKKPINRVKFIKFLGVLLDENISWKHHLNQLSKKLARICGMFFKIRNFVPLNTLLCLYNALFLSFLQYGITVWGSTCTTYIDPIFKLQKKVVRAISFESSNSHSSPIFKDLKILKLSDVFHLKLLTFVYESIHKISPSCFHNFFCLSSYVHQYSTRQASRGNLYLNQKNTVRYGLNSLGYLGAKLWNELPDHIRSAKTKNMFKTKLKSHLIEIL